MHTSNYAKHKNKPNGVSIASYPPKWFTGRQYLKLAPKRWFFFKYKEDGDEQFYIEQYKKEVLDTLDPQAVYNELGSDAVLLCYEKVGDFCHRHLVANWFKEKLGIEVTEL
jgi:hypothetical protein